MLSFLSISTLSNVHKYIDLEYIKKREIKKWKSKGEKRIERNKREIEKEKTKREKGKRGKEKNKNKRERERMRGNNEFY